MKLTKIDRFRYPIVESCIALHGNLTGAPIAIRDEESLDFIEWLQWRITEGWHENPSILTSWLLFDNSVRQLALSTISMWESAHV